MMITTQSKRRLLVGLSIGFGVLTLTALGFGFTTALVLGARGAVIAEPTPTPTATPTKTPPSATIDGYRISAITDLAVERFALTADYDGSANLYAILKNEDGSQSAETTFDVTAYRADGTIVDRAGDIVYIPAGGSGTLRVGLPEDLSEVETIIIEQIRIERSAPDVTGGISVVAMPGESDTDLFAVQFTSELSRPVEDVDVIVFAYDDDEVIGACKSWEDIPASGSPFDGLCTWEPAAIEDPVTEGPFPEGTTFEAYPRLDGPED